MKKKREEQEEREKKNKELEMKESDLRNTLLYITNSAEMALPGSSICELHSYVSTVFVFEECVHQLMVEM